MAKKDQKKVNIKDLENQIVELTNKWKRALADYSNLERRVETQQQQFVRLANLTLYDKLLPILDDLERAAKHINDNGLRMILKQFDAVLESEGVLEIKTQDENFDPNSMDCLEMVKGEKNKVVEVRCKGYRLGEAVIRPAKVTVGDGLQK